MTIDVRLINTRSKPYGVKISNAGELITAGYAYNEVSTQTLGTASTVYNFFKAKVGYNFIIQNLVIYANKNVGAGDATLTIYEAASSTSSTSLKDLLVLEIPQKTNVPIPGNLNLKVSEGRFLNATTDDDDIFLTIMGYYVPVNGD